MNGKRTRQRKNPFTYDPPEDFQADMHIRRALASSEAMPTVQVSALKEGSLSSDEDQATPQELGC